jgi:hypothetical protein
LVDLPTPHTDSRTLLLENRGLVFNFLHLRIYRVRKEIAEVDVLLSFFASCLFKVRFIHLIV